LAQNVLRAIAHCFYKRHANCPKSNAAVNIVKLFLDNTTVLGMEAALAEKLPILSPEGAGIFRCNRASHGACKWSVLLQGNR